MSDPANLLNKIGLAREKLTGVLRACPRSAEPVAEVFDILLSIEREVIADAGQRSIPRKRGPKDAKTVESYRVETLPSGAPVLAEYRHTDAAPFRCPKDIVMATAVQVNRLGESKFADIHDAVREDLGERVPDYHVRTALRWMKHCGLVRHERARFGPASKKSLKAAVTKAWKELEAQS